MAQRATQAKTNGFDRDLVKSHVAAIEGFLAELESERGAYMAKCKGIRQSMKDAYDEAKEAGIPKQSLKALMKRLGLESRIEKIKTDMEDDQAETYAMLLEALGEFGSTPLGAAALERRRPGRPKKTTATQEPPQGEPAGNISQFEERLGRPEDGAAQESGETAHETAHEAVH